MHIGDFHPLVLHYPIVLLTAVAALDVFRFFSKKNFEELALWILGFAVIFLIPTIVSGLYAGQFYAQNNEVLITHRTMAYVTGGFSVLHLIIRMHMWRKKSKNRNRWFLLLSLINFALVAVTADFGGLLVFGKTIFSRPKL
ncbi:MAG: DUF2231 domain-containing protein [Verrucomicrobia bacterium]|nr:DUF2231 domain-containing protein [Verrucomicrobiota bacterium]